MTRPDGLEFKALATATMTADVAEPDAHGVIEALVAVTGVEDEVGDTIEPGAFRRTLRERPRPKVCLGHDWNRPIGKTLAIKELMPGDSQLPKKTADGRPWPREAGALWVRFQTNLDSNDGKAAFSAAKFYGPSESTYSFGYRTVRARPRGTKRRILDLDLYEYGPVLNPANRLATLQSIKSVEELSSLVDSERQDFETGDGDVETKTKYVRDASYWGMPIGTPIKPGMKPRGRTARAIRAQGKVPSPTQGVTTEPPKTGKPKPLKRAETKPEARVAAADAEALIPEPDSDARVRAENPKGRDAEYVAQLAMNADGVLDGEPEANRDKAFRGLLNEGITPNELREDLNTVEDNEHNTSNSTLDADDIDDLVEDYAARYAALAKRQARQRGGESDEDTGSSTDQPSVQSDRKPAPQQPKADSKKPTAKQKALLFAARPGNIMTYRRDDNGDKILAGPFPRRDGLIFQGNAASAHPMEKAGWVEAGYDGRHYILTDAGERLRVQLEAEDTDRQAQLREERRVAALGPASAAPADANVDANAAPLDMTAQEFADQEAAAQARRNRARNMAAEQATAAGETEDAVAADLAAEQAVGAIDIDAYRRRTNNPKAELAGGDRLVLSGAGTRSWHIASVDGLGVVRPGDFEELTVARAKQPGKTQLRDLANRLAGIRDAQGRPVPFDYPNPDTERSTPQWIRGWRDARGATLQSAMADVVEQWAQDNDLTYRRRGSGGKRSVTVPGGEPDAAGFRMRKAEELAPGDQVRLPDGTVGTVERSGADNWRRDPAAEKIAGKVLFDDGRVVDIYDLGGIEKQQPVKPPPGARLDDYEVARKRGAGVGPASRDILIPIKFADGADSPDAARDPGMGSIPATAEPPGREFDFEQSDMANYVSSIRETYEPLPAGTRVASNEAEPDRFLPRDTRAKVGTALPLVADFNGELFQTVRLDDGTYDQWRVRGMRGASGSEGAFEIDPSPERVDQIRAQYGLPPVAESTPLRRDSEPEAVEEAAPAAEPPAPVAETRPARPPKLVATDLPEREALPYEVIKKPNRQGKGARVRFNGREYSVDATSGVSANVTVTDDDGHAATVAGGSSTLLRRDQFADRERALRQALNQVEAQHQGEVGNAQGEATVGGDQREVETPQAPEPQAPTPRVSRVAASGTLTSQTEVLAALDRTASANADARPGYASASASAAEIAEATRSGNRKVATSPQAPPGLYMLSPPAHMPKGGYPWEVQTASGVRVPIDALFVRSLEQFGPKSGKRSSLLLEAFGETVLDADGNPPPWGDVDTSWGKTWRDANGLTAGDAVIRFALPAYLRKIGANGKADEYERDLEPLPGAVEPETPEAVEPEVEIPETDQAVIPPDQIDEAAALQDEVAGITELPDGTIEVTEEVADRQDRVAALIEQDEAGALDLSSRPEPELIETRHDLAEELRLQSVLATRQATPKPAALKDPAAAPEKPPQRPGLAGAAEDYSEALQSGDTEAIARTRARLESSIRRSRAGSESARALADHITGEGDDDAEQLGTLATRLRREARERRNASARRRRTARRLERVRIQSLIDKIDAELQTRARSTEPQGEPEEPRKVIIPAFRLRYGGLTDEELAAARIDARRRAATDLAAKEELNMIRAELDWRESAARDVAKAPPEPVTPSAPLTDEQYAEHTARVEAALNAALADGQATDRVFTVDGAGAVWLPERAQAHKEIIDALWAKADGVPRDGEALIAGGLGGAGKSTVLRGGAGVDQSRYLTINPDDVKEEMVARGLVPDVPGLSPMEASPIVHEESSHIANMLAKRAYKERVNVIWDITMSRKASVAKRIDELRAAGYGSIDAVFVDIPVEKSVERALSRHRRGMEKFRAGQGPGGRYVPPALIRANASRESSSANREVFDGLRGDFASWVVFDNSVEGRDPVKIEGFGRWADDPVAETSSSTAPIASSANALAANYEAMHGTAGVRAMVERLRARKNLSAGDQALLAALEARLTSRDDSTNVVPVNEEWTGKNWRQALRDLPVEQRRQIQDAVGAHRYKVYADERAKGADHDTALRAASGTDESGPSLYAGTRRLELVAAEQFGFTATLRGVELTREMDRQQQRLNSVRKNYGSKEEIPAIRNRIGVLAALVEQDRALTQTGRASDAAFTDNPAKMSPARLRAQIFALERSQNALDRRRLAQLRRAADKRGIPSIAGQSEERSA